MADFTGARPSNSARFAVAATRPNGLVLRSDSVIRFDHWVVGLGTCAIPAQRRHLTTTADAGPGEDLGRPRDRCAPGARNFGWSWLTLSQPGEQLERAMGIGPTLVARICPIDRSLTIAAVLLHQHRMAVLLTLQALARQLKIVPLLHKPGSLQRHRDVSRSVPSLKESHLEP